MKPDLVVFVITLALTICNAQEPEVYSKEFQNALQYGAKSKLTLNVSVEKGSPVSNATARVYFNMGSAIGKTVTGETDESGVFATEGLCADYADFSLEKNGFYKSVGKYVFQSLDPERLKDGCWLPWNPTIPVMLREIRNPIPMYIMKVHGKFPNGETVGFDCEKGQFLAPYGEGENADFNITMEVEGLPYKHMKHLIHLGSPDPDGGFLMSELNQSSAFRSDYYASEFGYKANLSATWVYDVRQGVTGSVLYGNDEYLMFKSRIKRDEKGTIVSANYGKIYGNFVYGRGDDEMKTVSVGFLYYFNQTPNDRNLEFDGKNNLFFPQNKFSPYDP